MKTDTIEKHVDLKAPISRVWRALTDPAEFGKWFSVKWKDPFVVGKVVRGKILYPGFEKLKFEITIKKMKAESLFSYTWHPYALDPKLDYSTEKPTLVEFHLVESKLGTLLTVVESGFENIPAGRRLEAFRMNSGGWAEQMRNIKKYVTKK